MRLRHALAGAAALALAIAGQARAQTAVPDSAANNAGVTKPVQAVQPVYPDAGDGHAHVVRPGDGLPVAIVSGGAGGGPVTGALGSFADGWNITLGAEADTACASDNGTCTSQALFKRANQRLTSLIAAMGTPMQATGGTVGLVAGAAIVGKVGIDQTTPGTTNGVNQIPCAAAGCGLAPVPSSAAEACHILKNAAGNVYGFTLNTTGSASANDWVMLIDSATVPADGAVTPIDWGRVSANQTFAWSAPPGAPARVAAGAVVCLSTTGPLTKTAEAQAAISGKVD